MKIFITLFIMFTFSAAVFAQLPARKYDNLPKGTFKKTRSGKIVQYDKNGKKIGTYKLNEKRYVKAR